MKVIVQAGGLGTRMKGLTALKPKVMISVFNKPILFHLFDLVKKKAPSSEFIIIGDYKFEVLEKYLTVFAKNNNYILTRSQGKGNAAGIKDALRLVPENEPVMIVWSDLILPETLNFEPFDGCQVGVVDFPCSWSVKENKLTHVPSNRDGLAGLYIFSDKSLLDSLPEEGSFTEWLASQSFPIKALPLTNCKDVGTLQAFQNLDNSKYRCRPYNQITIDGERVVKTGLTPDAKVYIEREVSWYNKLASYGFENMPKLLSSSPMTLSRIKGQNLFLSALTPDAKRQVFVHLLNALENLHSLDKKEASSWDIYNEYFKKTIDRLRSVSHAIPFANRKIIKINGKDCINVLQNQSLLREKVLKTLMNTFYTPIHGDCQLTNTLLDENGKIFFIDPRGYFGKSLILGDCRYDWAKVYFAIAGNFDQFNIKNFTLCIDNDSVNYQIGSGGWEFLKEFFFSQLPTGEGNEKEIELIHSIIWLSMASHAWEDFDSMCVAFYNGTYLFNAWLEKYNEK